MAVNNLVFTRVDDRLIHGQVMTSWLKVYNTAKHILIVDDATSKDPFMGKMFSLLVPSGIGALPLRTFATKELMRRFPAVIRGNGSEIMFLAGAPTGGRGSESLIPSEDAVQGAQRLAGVTHAAVLVAGATDYVAAEGTPVVSVLHAARPRFAGEGCIQGALCAAFLGALGTRARWEAALAASIAMAVATEKALKVAKGPASFSIALVDALAALTPADVQKLGKVKVAKD